MLKKRMNRWLLSSWRLSFFLYLVKVFQKKKAGKIIYENSPDEKATNWKVQLNISGTVQGVGFRYTATQLAEKFHLTGVVRNQPDSTVYIEAVGRRRKIETFIEKLSLGPAPQAEIDQIRVKFEENIEERVKFSQTD